MPGAPPAIEADIFCMSSAVVWHILHSVAFASFMYPHLGHWTPPPADAGLKHILFSFRLDLPYPPMRAKLMEGLFQRLPVRWLLAIHLL